MYLDKESRRFKWWAAIRMGKLTKYDDIEDRVGLFDTYHQMIDFFTYKPYNWCQYVRQAYIFPFIAGFLNTSSYVMFFGGLSVIGYSLGSMIVHTLINAPWITVGLTGLWGVAFIAACYLAYRFILKPVSRKVADSAFVEYVTQKHDQNICKEITYVKESTDD